MQNLTPAARDLSARATRRLLADRMAHVAALSSTTHADVVDLNALETDKDDASILDGSSANRGLVGKISDSYSKPVSVADTAILAQLTWEVRTTIEGKLPLDELANRCAERLTKLFRNRHHSFGSDEIYSSRAHPVGHPVSKEHEDAYE